MDALSRLDSSRAVERLFRRDVTLFSEDAAVQASVAARLGWLDLVGAAPALVGAVEPLHRDLADEGITDVVVLGMGGSSLAALVLTQVLGRSEHGARVHVVDSTSPIGVASLLDELDPVTTAIVVASKSGTTIEPLTLYRVFRAWLEDAVGDVAAGPCCLAITDAGTPLDTLGRQWGFRAVVNTPADVGGRYSALSAFGLVPALFAGADVAELVGRALEMETRCAVPDAENPAVRLAAFVADAYAGGRDKLTVVTSPVYASFALWVEQLVAESLGKEGAGVIPVAELAAEPPIAGYGSDRAVAVVRAADDTTLAAWAADARAAGLPVTELVLADRFDLGGEFVRWETAVALLGHLMGVNPFDEPNVAEAKRASAEALEWLIAEGMPDEGGAVEVEVAGSLTCPIEPPITLADGAGVALDALAPGDYLAILAYLPDEDELLAPLRAAVPHLASALGRAVCLELGPRYLHSTGQLHKGGPNTGVFVVVTTRDAADVAIPEELWTLGALHRAQAFGDIEALASHGRRVLWVDLPDASRASIEAFADGLSEDAIKA